jgi:competence protein ComEA
VTAQEGATVDRAGIVPLPGLCVAAAITFGGVILLLILALQRSALHTPNSPNRGVEALTNLKLDVNRASAAEISVLPGIGPALAARIVEERARGGPFTSIDDLSRVPGIGPAIAARIAPLLSFPAVQEFERAGAQPSQPEDGEKLHERPGLSPLPH